MKKLSIIVAVLMLLTSLVAGCAPAAAPQPADTQAPAQTTAPTAAPTAAPTEKPLLKITFVTPLIGLPVWLDAKYGAEAAGKDLGAEIAWVGPEGIDINSQVEQTELAIANKVDGIIGCPLNPTAFEPVYQKALEAGIPVVNTAVDCKEDLRLAFIGTDVVNFGVMAADAIAKKMDGKANVAIICTALDTGNQLATYESFKKTIEAKYPDIKIITREADDSDMMKAIDKVNSILSTYPEVNVIWGTEANVAPAAGKVLEEKKLTDKILVLGVDDMADTIDAIKKGTVWGTLTQNFYKMGYEAVKFIVDSKAGTSVPSITDSGMTLVTKENVETYKK